MARHFKTYEDYRRHLKNKWGQGDGKNYKPWFTIRDVKDKNAFRSEISGLKTERVHHFLSSLETQLFYILEYRDDVVDIREQFPLIPLELSQKIASTLDIKHPTVISTNIPFIMTTDILVTLYDGNKYSYQAYCVKPEAHLKNLRILEKIEIERVWWESIGVNFKVFVGNKNCEKLSRNIAWATDPIRSKTQYDLLQYLDQAVSLLFVGKHIKSDICDAFVTNLGVDTPNALNILRTLIAQKTITVDMSNLLEEANIITIKNIASNGKRIIGEN